MSQGQAMPLATAEAAAVDLVELLRPACARIEIAGSIRRRKAQVHDLELVAIPRWEEQVSGLWGDQVERTDALDARVSALIAAGVLRVRSVEIRRADGTTEFGVRMGQAYKALRYDDVPVDLFVTDAERWGCIFALRTGPHDWNVRLVTDCKTHWRRVADGRVLYHERPLATPEEADFFNALGVPWIEPRDRRVERLRFDLDLLRAVPA